MQRLSVSILCAIVAAVPVAAQLKTPADWKWRLDSPASLVTTLDVPERSWLFVGMPPGWHITTGPGALLYPTDALALTPNYAVESTIFLFPGESREEYGLFLGGREIESERPPEYTAFVLRRDGQAAVLKRTASGLAPIVDWQAHDGIVPHRGGGKDAGQERAASGGRSCCSPTSCERHQRGEDSACGPAHGRPHRIRIGSGVNLHISSLDVTTRLAPAPTPKKGV